MRLLVPASLDSARRSGARQNCRIDLERPSSDSIRQEPSFRFNAGPVVTAVSHHARLDHGLKWWVDGSVGILRYPSNDPHHVLVTAPNGPQTAIHRAPYDAVHDRDGALDWRALIRHPIEASAELTNARQLHDHASGGPITTIAGLGGSLVTYHAERFLDADPADFVASIGLALLDERDGTLHDVGLIVSAHPDDVPGPGRGPLEMGPGATVTKDGYVWVYFMERSNRFARCNLGVARASVDHVQRSIAAGRTPRFWKWDGSGFGAPGLGGRAAELLPGIARWMGWLDAAVIEPSGEVLLVAAVADAAPGEPAVWNHFARTSADGINWSCPLALHPGGMGDEILFVSIDSRGIDQRRINAGVFDLIFLRADPVDRWSDASLCTCTVTISSRRETASGAIAPNPRPPRNPSL